MSHTVVLGSREVKSKQCIGFRTLEARQLLAEIFDNMVHWVQWPLFHLFLKATVTEEKSLGVFLEEALGSTAGPRVQLPIKVRKSAPASHCVIHARGDPVLVH